MRIFMSASIMVTIILAVIGLLKLPFKKFKEKHPKGYKAVFTISTIVLSVGLCVIDQLFIEQGEIVSLDFATLLSATIAGVFGTYNGIYEGLSVKELFKKLAENLKKWSAVAKQKNAQKKFLAILTSVGVGVDKVQELLNAAQPTQPTEPEQPAQPEQPVQPVQPVQPEQPALFRNFINKK